MRRWRALTGRAGAAVAGVLALVVASGGGVSAAAEGPPSDWDVVPVPRINGRVDLTGVVAFGPSDAWAVGSVGDVDGVDTLTMHWDGRRWARVPSPSPGPQGNWLVDVAGSSPTDVWAVGSYLNEARERRTLLMHWDGTGWTTVPSPNAMKESLLNGVAAVSPTDAWAVGSALDESFSGRTLVQHWDGVSWTIVPSPSPSEIGVGSNLLGVAAASPADVWAVGDVDMGEFVMGTLTERWDGTSWRAVESPTVPAGALLGRVAVDDSGAAWAVGWRQVGEFSQPLAMRWTGTQWSITDAPSSDGAMADFTGVAIVGPNDVWAVGEQGGRTLAARWDGESWAITASASPGSSWNRFGDVAAVPGTGCLWAVGSYANSHTLSSALIERHCAGVRPGR